MNDCYFWVNDGEEQKVNALCVDCHDKKHPKLGWFWEGSRLGYGPFDFVCGECGAIIYAAPNNTERVEE